MGIIPTLRELTFSYQDGKSGAFLPASTASFCLSMDMTDITNQSQLSYIFNIELQAVATNQSELSGEKKPIHHLCSNRRTDKVVWEEEAGFRVR